MPVDFPRITEDGWHIRPALAGQAERYLGMVGSGESYKLTKYTDVAGNTLTSRTSSSKVGLLRLGELMAGQFDIYSNNTDYRLLTTYISSNLFGAVLDIGEIISDSPVNTRYGVRPSLNLKSNVIITGGDGTKNNPFTLDLA